MIRIDFNRLVGLDFRFVKPIVLGQRPGQHSITFRVVRFGGYRPIQGTEDTFTHVYLGQSVL